MLEGLEIIAPSGAKLGNADIPAAVRAALDMPDGSTNLTVLVNDPQRHTDSRSVLAALATMLPSPSRCRILVATGTHAFSAGARRAFERRLIGGLHFDTIAWHDCLADDLRRVAGCWMGHPWLTDGQPVLAIGSVEPHYFAGFTGAHKTCTIGIAACDDIEQNHAHALSPLSAPTVLDTNPVAQGVFAMLAALESRVPVAAVNLVQAGADILAAAGCAPADALAACIPSASAAFVRHLNRPADALIAEVSGPLGESFYQADKGIKNTDRAVRDGGCLVLVAPCGRGIGQDRFTNLLRRAATYAEAMAAVESAGYSLGDHKAVRLRYLTDPACRGVRVYVVSDGLSESDADLLGLHLSPSVEAALAHAIIQPARDTIVHVRDAGNLCVLCGHL